jgi:UDP-GlcNAc3NAcA epimerase
MKSVLTIVGARPQFVKCAAVSQRLRRVAVEVLVHTGQHYDENMSDVFFNELNIPAPDYNLAIGSGSHAAQTAAMLQGIEALALAKKPDAILVYGDTNSTLAGALAAAKLHIPVMHVEAGLRSFNKRMPEEINRVLTDHVSALLFCPTETARGHLAREGIEQGVLVVGDVMEDALLLGLELAGRQLNVCERFGVATQSYGLVTIHRAENTDAAHRMRSIIEALNALARGGMAIIFPAHPRTKQYLQHAQIELHPLVRVVDPLPFAQMVSMTKNARVVLTDSGGLQKEAMWLGVPCVTLRDETEWVETVQSGWNDLVGADTDAIVHAATRSTEGLIPHELSGGAADRIVAEIATFLSGR